jgi:hypothetical protein
MSDHFPNKDNHGGGRRKGQKDTWYFTNSFSKPTNDVLGLFKQEPAARSRVDKMEMVQHLIQH